MGGHTAEVVAKPGPDAGLKNPYAVSYQSPYVVGVKKGLFYGTILAAGTSLVRGYKIEAAGLPKNAPVNPEKAWATTQSYFKGGALPIVGTLTGFLLIRTYFESAFPQYNGGVLGLVAPLTIAAAPAVAYQLVKKAPVPEAYQIGLIYSVLQHGYDRAINVDQFAGWKGKPN